MRLVAAKPNKEDVVGQGATRRRVLKAAAVPFVPATSFWGPAVVSRAAAEDPALVAFRRVGEAEAALTGFVGDQWGEAFEAVLMACRDAGQVLAATPAAGLAGAACKLRYIVESEGWTADEQWTDARLTVSALADLDRWIGEGRAV